MHPALSVPHKPSFFSDDEDCEVCGQQDLSARTYLECSLLCLLETLLRDIGDVHSL